jgi:hypothetical protein
MNLVELYKKLPLSDSEKGIFNAFQIPDFPNCRIAINFNGYPVILLSVSDLSHSLKNIRLKYLQLEQNIKCKITDNTNTAYQTFTVITFTNYDKDLQEYFLKISEVLVKTIGNEPSQQEVIESLNGFIEVFRSMTDIPTNTVRGLWTELFLIESAKDSSTLLNYWHDLPEEKFDFNYGSEKIEVKSNSSFLRQHTFSSDQLNPPAGTQVLIASIFIKPNIFGKSIQQLIESILLKVNNNISFANKLNSIVCKTLGNSIEESIKIKFDYTIAKDSLVFYRHQDIYKIEKSRIPHEVSAVRYISDLSSIMSLEIEKLTSKGTLFQSI